MYLLARPDDRFVVDLALIALAFEYILEIRDDFNALLVVFVVTHRAMQIKSVAIAIYTETQKYDVIVLVALARDIPAGAITQNPFLRTIAALTVHANAASSDIETLHFLQQYFLRYHRLAKPYRSASTIFTTIRTSVLHTIFFALVITIKSLTLLASIGPLAFLTW